MPGQPCAESHQVPLAPARQGAPVTPANVQQRPHLFRSSATRRRSRPRPSHEHPLGGTHGALMIGGQGAEGTEDEVLIASCGDNAVLARGRGGGAARGSVSHGITSSPINTMLRGAEATPRGVLPRLVPYPPHTQRAGILVALHFHSFWMTKMAVPKVTGTRGGHA